MRLNTDCIRDILLAIESMEYGEIWTINTLAEILPDYSINELQYHCIQLVDAQLINASIVNVIKSPPMVAKINDLTYLGHQFLADIRSDTTWNKTKRIAKIVGSESLHALKDIAINVVTTAIQNQFCQP